MGPWGHVTGTHTQGGGQMVLDLLVENAGRVNYGSLLDSRKGKVWLLLQIAAENSEFHISQGLA